MSIGEVAATNLEHGEVDLMIRKLRPVSKLSFPERPASVGSHPPSVIRDIHVPRRAGAVWACVGLGIVLGIALPYWPYPHACGWWLLMYGAAAGMEVVAGIWGARLTWNSRLGFAHSFALATVLWGLALIGREVLPRVGYAKIHAGWFCQ